MTLFLLLLSSIHQHSSTLVSIALRYQSNHPSSIIHPPPISMCISYLAVFESQCIYSVFFSFSTWIFYSNSRIPVSWEEMPINEGDDTVQAKSIWFWCLRHVLGRHKGEGEKPSSGILVRGGRLWFITIVSVIDGSW